MRTVKYLILITLFFLFLVAIFSLPIQAVVPSGNYLQLLGGYVKSSNSDQSIPSGFTFEAWIYPTSISGIQKIISIGDKSKNNPSYEVGINGGSLQFIMGTGVNQNGIVSISTGSIEAGKWSHIAVTTNGGTPRLYINGVSQFNGISIDVIYPLMPVGPSIILSKSYLEPLAGGNSFSGSIDEVRVSNIVRDISLLWNSGTYNQQLSTDGNTVLLWHLDETRGANVVTDASANHLNGSLIGGDEQVHFFGILPTPTLTPTPTPWTYALPPIDWQRPVFPTLSLPQTGFSNPISNPAPAFSQSYSFYSGDVRSFDRAGDRFNGR